MSTTIHQCSIRPQGMNMDVGPEALEKKVDHGFDVKAALNEAFTRGFMLSDTIYNFEAVYAENRVTMENDTEEFTRCRDGTVEDIIRYLPYVPA